jgi:hypothetical protein
MPVAYMSARDAARSYPLVISSLLIGVLLIFLIIFAFSSFRNIKKPPPSPYLSEALDEPRTCEGLSSLRPLSPRYGEEKYSETNEQGNSKADMTYIGMEEGGRLRARRKSAEPGG